MQELTHQYHLCIPGVAHIRWTIKFGFTGSSDSWNRSLPSNFIKKISKVALQSDKLMILFPEPDVRASVGTARQWNVFFALLSGFRC
jgi:hypothetical protein